jgi:hypothetical protein
MLRGPRISYGYKSGMASMYIGWIRKEFIFEVKYAIMKEGATLELMQRESYSRTQYLLSENDTC